MKEFRFKIIIIAAAFALSIYLLYPTYSDYQNSKNISESIEKIADTLKASNTTMSEADIEAVLTAKEDSIFASDPSFKDAREKRIKLGLDLQGGMYLVMEVNTAKLFENLAKDPDDVYKSTLAEAKAESEISDENVVSILTRKLQEKSIRLSRYFGSRRDEDADIIDNLLEQESDAVTRAIEVLNNRINQYGVSEPSIQKQGSRRIIVELPGIAKEEEAKQLLQGTALLEFKFVKDGEFSTPILNRIDEVLAKSLAPDSAQLSNLQALEDSLGFEAMNEEEKLILHPFFSYGRFSQYTRDIYVNDVDRDKISDFLKRDEVKRVIPDNVEFKFSAKPITNEQGEQFYTLFLLNKKPELTGGVIESAQANIDPTTSEPIVYMSMNAEGTRDWARITGANVGRRIAVVLDGFVYTAPNIQEKIPSGSTRISGMDDANEAKLLEIVLKAGALPAPVDIIEERTVGPSLGQDSISKGFNSTLIGFLLVAVFMIIYYRRAGTVADLALFFTILFILGILAAFKATLTLPGIAGIILTIGMAVDANVIIYERIREELKTGKTVKAAIESGYSNSYSAIFDSNITTFFTGIILYQFGSGPIQGFALTLMIGIVCSLFSALVVTRLVFDVMAAKGAKINIG
jgi:preprotein translocase subunit SecD